MSERFDPLAAGIYRRYVNGDLVDSRQWNRAHAAGEIVGDCRHCGGWLIPSTVSQTGQIEWFEAHCNSCGHDVAAPDGRVLRRSARHSEQPTGWREGRVERLKRAGVA